MNRIVSVLARASALALVVWLSGCEYGTYVPVWEYDWSRDGLPPFEPGQDPNVPRETTRASALVGPAGGEVRLPSGARLALPPGALAAETWIELTEGPRRIGQFDRRAFTITPPLVLARPARFTVPPSGAYSVYASSWNPCLGGSITGAGELTALIVRLEELYLDVPCSTYAFRATGVHTYPLGPNELSLNPEHWLPSTSVWVREGVSWRSIEGTRHFDGVYEVRDVPVAGAVWLQAGQQYFRIRENAVDFGVSTMWAQSHSQNARETTWEFTLGNLASWEDQDSLTAWDTASGTHWGALNANAPVVGATRLDRFAVTAWSWARLLLQEDDRLWLVQRRMAHAVGGWPHRRVERAFSTAGLQEVDGVTTSFTGEFAAVAHDRTAALTWDGPAFVAVAREGVSSDAGSAWFYISAQPPAPASDRWVQSGLNLIESWWMGNSSTVPPVGSLSYGLPDSMTGWTPFLKAGATMSKQHLIDGGQQHWATTSVSVRWPLGTFEELTVTPRIGPVQNVQLDWKPLSSTVRDVSDAPLLTWQPPNLGFANRYDVRIQVLENVDGQIVWGWLYEFFTDEPDAPLPPGLLLEGNAYAFEVVAVQEEGLSWSSPLRPGPSAGRAGYLGELVYP